MDNCGHEWLFLRVLPAQVISHESGLVPTIAVGSILGVGRATAAIGRISSLSMYVHVPLCPCLYFSRSLASIVGVQAQMVAFGNVAMDGLGLDDQHAHVLTAAMQSSLQCKMGDLLGL